MKITVVGENCLDVFIYGDSNRLSPEAPVPVFIPIEKISNEGMAGNVYRNLLSIDPDLKVHRYHQKSEIKKTRYVDKKSNHMFIRVDEESQIDKFELNKEITDSILDSDATIVSDYDKGFLSHDDIEKIGKLSKFSVLDSKKKITESILESFDFVKLNESEFKSNSFLDHNLPKIIITLGSRGAKYINELYPSPDPRETIDVSGAGDTFTAAFVFKYLFTKDVNQSISYANKLSSVVVSKRGVAVPH